MESDFDDDISSRELSSASDDVLSGEDLSGEDRSFKFSVIGTISMTSTSGDGIKMNEWGEYTEIRESSAILPGSSSGNLLVERVRNNDPGITSVSAYFSTIGGSFDWAAAGKAVGCSDILKHVNLNFSSDRYRENHMNVLAFCKGLALNRSIYALELQCCTEEEGVAQEIFEALHSIFSNNNNLKSIVFRGDIFPVGLEKAIEAAPSLQSVMIHAFSQRNDVTGTIQAICRKQGLLHITVKKATISIEAGHEIKNMLSDQNCGLTSLALPNVVISDEAGATAIAEGLAENNSVECLRFSSESLLTALQSRPLKALRTIEVGKPGYSSHLVDAEFAGFLQHAPNLQDLSIFFFNQTMKVVKADGCWYSTPGGHRILFSAIESNAKIEEIDIKIAHDEDVLELLPGALATNSKLRSVCLSVHNVQLLQMISDALANPTCSLEALHIYQGMVYLMDLQLFVDALQWNSTLKYLQLTIQRDEFVEDDEDVADDFDWSPFFSLLCDKSSVEATYSSNHTLENLDAEYAYNNGLRMLALPSELSSMLRANESTNKLIVARKKVLENHSFENVNFAPSVLPLALSQFGSAEIDSGLSLMYTTLRKVPHLIGKEERKRKWNDHLIFEGNMVILTRQIWSTLLPSQQHKAYLSSSTLFAVYAFLQVPLIHNHKKHGHAQMGLGCNVCSCRMLRM